MTSSRWKALTVAAALCAHGALHVPAMHAAPPHAGDAPLCPDETVYGTVVILDRDLGVFGLVGTEYKFQSIDAFDLEALHGRMVKLDIAADCGIEDLRILDGYFESIT